MIFTRRYRMIAAAGMVLAVYAGAVGLAWMVGLL